MMEVFNNPQSENMIVGNCVVCEGLVRVPLNANPNSIVRCPRCNADFRLIELLEKAAPILEVVEDQIVEESELRKPRFVPILDNTPPQPDGRKPGDKFVVSPILQKNSKRKKHRRRHRSSENSGSPTQKSNPTGPAVGDPVRSVEPSHHSAPSRATVQTSATPGVEKSNDVRAVQRPAKRRPKSRKVSISSSNINSNSSSSRGVEIAKIVLGAALALPVAQLLVWWFAGTDPLNLGPTVSQIVPFVVPAEFQPEKQKDKDEFFENAKPAGDLNDVAGASSNND